MGQCARDGGAVVGGEQRVGGQSLDSRLGPLLGGPAPQPQCWQRQDLKEEEGGGGCSVLRDELVQCL